MNLSATPHTDWTNMCMGDAIGTSFLGNINVPALEQLVTEPFRDVAATVDLVGARYCIAWELSS